MAMTFICDACGKPTAEPKTLGIAIKRDYCGECAPMIEDMQAAKDRAHERAVEKFNEKMDAARVKFVALHPDARLPDEA